jgi:hypothetical protein
MRRDMVKGSGAATMVAATIREFGDVDGPVHIPGLFTAIGPKPFEQVSDQGWMHHCNDKRYNFLHFLLIVRLPKT